MDIAEGVGRGEGGGTAQIWPSLGAPEERGTLTELDQRQQGGAGQLGGRHRSAGGDAHTGDMVGG